MRFVLLPLSVQGSFFSRIDALLSGRWSPRQLHIPVRTGGMFYFPWHRHQIEGTNGLYCLIRKTLAKRGKRNCQSSEEKSYYRSVTRTIDRPVAGRRPSPLGHRSPITCWMNVNSFFGFLLSHDICLTQNFTCDIVPV